MEPYKEYTLLTFEDFKAKFKPEADIWQKYSDGSLYIKWKKCLWTIGASSFEIFGSKVKAKKFKEKYNNNFTHRDISEKYRYHESWFEPEFKPIIFIEENEMMI